MTPGDLTFKLSDEFTRKLILHSAVSGEILVVTMDKVELCLMKNRDLLTSKHQWLTPVGLFFSFVATLTAVSTFNDLILKADVWHAMFVLLAVGTFVWSLVAVGAALKLWGRGGIDDICKDLKARGEQLTNPQDQEA